MLTSAHRVYQTAGEKVKLVTGQLSALKSTMQRNKPLEPLQGAAADVPLWNRLLQQQQLHGEEGQVLWFAAPWLFVECYMYRKICELMQNRYGCVEFGGCVC